MLHRDRRDGRLIAPKQNKRRAADSREHWRAQKRGDEQRQQRGHDQFFVGDGRMNEEQTDCAGDQQGNRPSLPMARRVPDEPQSDQSKTDGQHQFNDPGGNVVGDAAAPLFFRQEKL